MKKRITDKERLDILIMKAKESRTIRQDTVILDILVGGREDIDAAIRAESGR